MKTHARFIEVCIKSLAGDDLDVVALPDIMGFGTSRDEIIFGIQAAKDLLQLQREQSLGWEMDYHITPLFRRNDQGNAAIMVDKVQLIMHNGDQEHHLNLRITTCLEKIDDQWKVVHWHGSIPQESTSEDTWHIGEWKRKTEELQKLVDEKTAQLLQQNRELEIEAALERVRSTAMAMHKPKDILNVCEVVFKELLALGFEALRNTIIHVFDDDKKYFTDYDYSDLTGGTIARIPFTGNSVLEKFINKMRSSKDSFFEMEVSGKEFEAWKAFRRTTDMNEDPRLEDALALYYYVYSVGVASIGISSFQTINLTQLDLLKRFRNVFDLAYGRYGDIRKAEEQAREAQVEAALEKIRSRSLAANKTDEFNEVVKVVFEKLSELQIPVSSVTIATNKENSKDLVVYGCGEGEAGLAALKFHLPYFPNAFVDDLIQEQSKSITGYRSKVYSEEDKNNYYDYVFKQTELKNLPEDLKDQVRKSKSYGLSTAYSRNSAIMVNDFEGNILNEGQADILKRFSRVFEQAYIRFLDLKKAEAQAREGQIQLALERVRSRTMAMHKSDELPETSHILFEQMNELGEPAEQLTIGIVREELNIIEISATLHGDTLKKVYNHSIDEPYMMNKVYKAWKTHQKTLIVELKGEELNAYNRYRNELTHSEMFPTNLGDETRRIVYAAFFSKGMLALGTNEVRPPQSLQLLGRFASVFDLTYTRFLDLQKAEAQAREAKIEAALEKVRSRTMAMHKADELHQVVTVVVEKLMDLGVILDANGAILCTYFPDSRDVLHWIASPDFSFTGSYLLPYFEHPIFRAAWESRSNGDEYFSKSFSVEEKNSFFEHAFKHSDYKYFPDEFKEWVFQNDKHSLSFAWTENAAILIPSHTGVVPEGEDIEILKRFARVFEQAYVRFMDLQKAEKATRETQIELSLERIRAQVTSMQESSDLLDIMVAMRKEFVALGLEAHYFWYMRWLPETYEKAMTSGDGTKIGNVMTLPRKIHKEIKAIAQWEKGDDPTIIHVMDAEAAIDYVHKMIEWGDFHQVDHNVPGDDDLRHIGGLTYVMARTSQGEIGYSLPGMVPNPPAEAVNTLRRFASVFDLAYSRFEDLRESELQSRKILEERNRLEKTLAELRSTQSQLIHAEKMASLGELTAGIAHEIQNPLNFVNNFSEVSTEMVKEVVEELEKGDIKETQDILQDLKKNLEKIRHHGHRASSIVRSMLDHSRTSSGEKVDTDLNALCDEYLRLAYHGMRAKERNFNAAFETKVDPDLPRIKVVAQELGRVLLNLIGNAFQAVKNVEQPKVIITTRNLGDYIEIGVTDNGHGIPVEIRDKIFQPFFTTKPTGQGTGLGLSLAYDIVKAHGGEIDVVSESGSGTTFILKIPVGIS